MLSNEIGESYSYSELFSTYNQSKISHSDCLSLFISQTNSEHSAFCIIKPSNLDIIFKSQNFDKIIGTSNDNLLNLFNYDKIELDKMIMNSKKDGIILTSSLGKKLHLIINDLDETYIIKIKEI